MNLMTFDNKSSSLDYDNWYDDNGATSHVTHRCDIFETFIDFEGSHTATTGNGDAVQAIGKGQLSVMADVNGNKQMITLNDDLYCVPNNNI